MTVSKTPVKKVPAKRTPRPKSVLPNFAVGQKLIPKEDTLTIVGKTTDGKWIVQEGDPKWADLETYTSEALAKDFQIYEGK